MLQGKKGFPKFYWTGKEGDYNILVIELLSRSLEDLLQACSMQFSAATTFFLAEQMVLMLRDMRIGRKVGDYTF